MFRKSKINPTAPEFYDKKSLEEALINFGISECASGQLSELGRFGLHLLPARTHDGAKRVFSKIGGIPDLPAGTIWPVRPRLPLSEKGSSTSFLGKLINKVTFNKFNKRGLEYRDNPQPYNFIAQISFEELAFASAQNLQLPQTGAFYLFYDDLIQCWGFDPEDAIGFKVIYVASIADATSAEKPEFLDEVRTYREVHVEPTLRFEHCKSENMEFKKLSVSEDDKDTYIEFDELVEGQSNMGWPTTPAHKVGGWANNVQGPMEEECALVTSGIYCGGPEEFSSPEAKRILEEPNEWVLLLQIDSDDNIGMMWGDGGMLYLWIKKSDLQNNNFNNTWLILQSR